MEDLPRYFAWKDVGYVKCEDGVYGWSVDGIAFKWVASTGRLTRAGWASEQRPAGDMGKQIWQTPNIGEAITYSLG